MEFKPKANCHFDVVALGEVMLRFDPGAERIRSARHFEVHEGGAEYNVARTLTRVFHARTALMSATVDNEIGRLLESLLLGSGVALDYLQWRPYDGIGKAARVPFNFTERGFGPRPLLGVSDRAHSAASQLSAKAFDLEEIFGQRGARVLHTGAIFSALSEDTAHLTEAVLQAARAAGTRTSYDLNYRASLWQERGGRAAALQLNRRLVREVEILFGGLEDLHALAGSEPLGNHIRPEQELAALLPALAKVAPQLQVIAATLTRTPSASQQHYGGVLAHQGQIHVIEPRPVEVFDRVGAGDAFAAGVLAGLLEQRTIEHTLAWAVASAELAMSTPGDACHASREEVLQRAAGGDVRARR